MRAPPPCPVPLFAQPKRGLTIGSVVGSFAGVLSNPLGNWQARNWDPAVGSLKVRSPLPHFVLSPAPHPLLSPSPADPPLLPNPGCSRQFYDFCAALTNRSSAASADDSDGRKREVVGNYAGWIREHEVKRCPGWEKKGGVERVRPNSAPLNFPTGPWRARLTACEGFDLTVLRDDRRREVPGRLPQADVARVVRPPFRSSASAGRPAD